MTDSPAPAPTQTPVATAPHTYSLIQGNSFLLASKRFIESHSIQTVFADPPDNIKHPYRDDPSGDKIPEDEYFQNIELLLLKTVPYINAFWLSFNARHTARMGSIITRLGFDSHPIIQTFTFGNYQRRGDKLTNNHRPLWLINQKYLDIRTSQGVTKFRPQRFPDRILVKSRRQELGDKRASPEGKVPGDVWSFPRVVGNSKQRRKWHSTQLNEGLVARALLYTCPPDSTVFDPFMGTGTTLRCIKAINKSKGLNLSLIAAERSATYCQHLRDEHPDLSFKKSPITQ